MAQELIEFLPFEMIVFRALKGRMFARTQLNFVSIHNNFNTISASVLTLVAVLLPYNEIKCAIGVFST